MQWIPTFTLFLFLYPAGWFLGHLIFFFNQNISANNLSIIGTIITFILFLIVLPSWGRIRWKTNNLWLSIGLDFKNIFRSIKIFLSGFFFSSFLLLIFYLFIYVCGWIDSVNYVKISTIFNAIVLIAGIVFAEEIIFRGWLLKEMVFLFGSRKGILFQSAIFSLAHYRSDLSFGALFFFLIGLFLFGLVLTFRRISDEGSLWGCVGLHGGLVGIWYLFDSGMVLFTSEIPFYLLGPSKSMVNPIGSLLGIIFLITIIFFQRKIFVKTRQFLDLKVND